MLRQIVWGDALCGGFPGHRFGTVLAKLKGGFVFFVRPRAARTVKTVGLIGAQQSGRRVEDIHLRAHRNRRGF
ncbi:hypothetical protein D3C86_2094370 [compost metagenome]